MENLSFQNDQTKVIKELSMDQFLGKRVAVKYSDKAISNRNKQIIEFFSKPIA